jgi:hypothetical protein
MPRYEYLVLLTESTYRGIEYGRTPAYDVLIQANGTPTGTPARPGVLFGGTAATYPLVYDYLNNLGAAGWEVVTSFGINDQQILLKRPLP